MGCSKTNSQVQQLHARGRAQIGKYALENVNTQAARHFSKVLSQKITESTMSRLRVKYGTSVGSKQKQSRRPGGEVLTYESTRKTSTPN